MKTENISDQKAIIELQEKLIAKQDDQLTGVKETVSSGMQSYASVVKNSCSEILSTKKITAAVIVKSAVEADGQETL